MTNNLIVTDSVAAKNEDELFSQVSDLIENARSHVKTVVNTAMVYTYYGVGKYIVDFEQNGEKRAEYGKQTLKNLSDRLTAKYEKGWSVETLHKAVRFYNEYSKSVYTVDRIHPQFCLSWNP